MPIRSRLRRRARQVLSRIVGADPAPPRTTWAPTREPRAASAVTPPAAAAHEPEVEPAPVSVTTAVAEPTPEPAVEPVAPAAQGAQLDAEPEVDGLRDGVVEALKTVFDPEIPVNIYELGLVYDVEVDPARHVAIRMTLTSPNCPAAQSLPSEVQQKALGVHGITSADVEVVWDPPWDPSRMSEEAKLELNLL